MATDKNKKSPDNKSPEKKNNDAKILTKINDISSFISKSIEDLEKIAKNKGFEKSESMIDSSLKPLTLNV